MDRNDGRLFGNGTQQPAQEKRKRSASPVRVEYDEGAKALKPEEPPVWPIKVEILERVQPTIENLGQLKEVATEMEILTFTDESFATLERVMPGIQTAEDLLDSIKSIKNLEKIKGVSVKVTSRGCLAFYLQCTDLTGLGELWFMYRSGELNNMFFSCLFSEVALQLSTKRFVVKATINVEDFKQAMVYILTTLSARGLDHATSVDNINTLPSPTRHAGHSSLRGLDLAMFSREDHTHKGAIDSAGTCPLTFTDQQVQTALRQVKKKLEQQASRLKVQTAKEGSEALILSLSKQVTMQKDELEKAQKVLLEHKMTIQMLEDTKKITETRNEELTAENAKLSNRLKLTHDELQEDKEKAQKVLLEHKETIQVLEDTKKTKEKRNVELTAENTKLSNRLRDSDKLQDEVRTLREKNEALQKLLLEKTQEIQQSKETRQGTGARPKSFGQQRDRLKQTTEHQNQGDDLTRKQRQPVPKDSTGQARNEEQTVTRLSAVPSHWDPQPTDPKSKKPKLCHLVKLESSSAEYKTVSSKSGLGNIVSIERVQNPTLWRQYCAQKDRISLKRPGQNIEQELWHGASADSCVKIYHNGFNRSYMLYAGVYGAAIGKGVYFAVNASYSDASPDASGHKRLFLAKVLTGLSTPGKPNLIVPPPIPGGGLLDTYDSTSGSGMFCVFHDAQAYPEYLITFMIT
ncbi:PREDICTED: poly [ADP-ribose] polymerase 14-like [Branchiostoma belcheri]|uniref:Poly [ADP-ribose] polymerase n=1 Tax=Branchiostoma belcheri TaxID=7741 RepID=A0A6P4YJ10_BRABE|nr:PREDICTED: poly [ADP-ribose] polymerase 14-like [Branchiostoma belcheri]